MIPLATAAEAAGLDASSSSLLALPPLILMENAAVRLWAALAALLKAERPQAGGGAGEPRSIVALVGSGNNGGDALAMLRQAWFEGRRDLAVVLVSRRTGELASLHLGIVKALGIPVLCHEEEAEKAAAFLASASLFIDGIAGTGLRGPLGGAAAALVATAREAARAGAIPVAAVDLPSGLGDEAEPDWPVLPATWTLSVEPRKACLYHPALRSISGRIIPVSGVFPAEPARVTDSASSPSQPRAFFQGPGRLLDEADLPSFAPAPTQEAHKGQRGRLALFAGSAGMAGAAALSARGAYAASAGLVILYADPDLFPSLSAGAGIEAFGPAIVRPLPEAGQGLGALGCNAALLGPGWGRSEAKRRALGTVLGSGLPTVLDADALRLFAEALASGLKPRGPLILTPHPGEFEALSGHSPGLVLARPRDYLLPLAEKLGAVVILKSHLTWMASPDGRYAVFEGLEPSLAVAGSGDVLAGLAAGLLAGLVSRQGKGASGAAAQELAFVAAQGAVLAHGVAGRRARKKGGWYETSALVAEAARCLDPNAAFL